MQNIDSQWGVPEAEMAMAAGPVHASPRSDGAPTPDEYLLRALEGHIAAERGYLNQYRELAESTKDPVVELIMGIILEDEERHHSLMRRLATRLNDDLYWAQTPDALRVPRPASVDPKEYESLRTFVASERTSVHELQDFAGRADGLYGGLPTALLEMMAVDSQKHEHLLRFLFRRLGQAMADAQRSA
jgi:rubrerythrin